LLSPEPSFVEIGHDFPSDIPSETMLQITETAQRALAAVGLQWGPTHVELRLTERGPAVIEINPRLAGGFIPEVVQEAIGIDLIEQTLRAVVGHLPMLQPMRLHHSSIRFMLTPKHGVLDAVCGLNDARAIPGVCTIQMYRRMGDQVCVHGDFRDRIGHVIAVGDSSDQSVTAAEKALLAIQLRVI
jgi:biotin carboxylase